MFSLTTFFEWPFLRGMWPLTFGLEFRIFGTETERRERKTPAKTTASGLCQAPACVPGKELHTRGFFLLSTGQSQRLESHGRWFRLRA